MHCRYLADADLNKAIVSGTLREPSIDSLTAHLAGIRPRMTDPEVLMLAAQQGRILISHDVGTMTTHFAAHKAEGLFSAGVFLIPQWLRVAYA